MGLRKRLAKVVDDDGTPKTRSKKRRKQRRCDDMIGNFELRQSFFSGTIKTRRRMIISFLPLFFFKNRRVFQHACTFVSSSPELGVILQDDDFGAAKAHEFDRCILESEFKVDGFSDYPGPGRE